MIDTANAHKFSNYYDKDHFPKVALISLQRRFAKFKCTFNVSKNSNTSSCVSIFMKLLLYNIIFTSTKYYSLYFLRKPIVYS